MVLVKNAKEKKALDICAWAKGRITINFFGWIGQTTANLKSDRRNPNEKIGQMKMNEHGNKQCNCYCTRGSPWIDREELLCNNHFLLFDGSTCAWRSQKWPAPLSRTWLCCLPSPLLQRKNTRKFDRRTNNGTSALDATRTEAKWTNAEYRSFPCPILVVLAESTRLRTINWGEGESIGS